MDRVSGSPPTADWLDELTLRPGPPWLAMGVRPLDLDDWLVLDDNYDEELALKRRLLAERPADVFAALPGTGAAGAEVLELVQAWLAAHDVAGRTGTAAGPSSSPPGTRLHPLDHAGRLVQEDLCLMVPTRGAYRLEAASLCFPSHWRLHDKLGRSLAAIHAPVPHYDVELEAKVDTFFDRLRTDRPVRRRNLSIHNHDELFRPEPHETPDSFAPDPSGIDQVWLRSERQTLLRLPRTGAVLFTIKTQHCPARALVRRPDVAATLAETLRADQAELERTGAAIAFPRWFPAWLEATAAGDGRPGEPGGAERQEPGANPGLRSDRGAG